MVGLGQTPQRRPSESRRSEVNTSVILTVVLLVMLGGTGFFSYRAGEAHVQAQIDAARVERDAAVEEAARKLAASEDARRAEAQRMEDKANAEPVSVPVALPPSRLRRINAAIAAANGTVPKP